MIDPTLVERVYEAAALPERWPGVLSELGRASGAAGAVFFLRSAWQQSWVASPEITEIFEEFAASGWMADSARATPLVAELHPGFRTDGDYYSAEERAALPVYRDFLIPNRIDAGAGTVFQGVNNDVIVLSIERFGSHAQAAAAIPLLDRLRPSLGRAFSLTAHLRAQTDTHAVAALELAGVPAAVVARDGRLRASNDRFAQRLGAAVDTRAGRLRFADCSAEARLEAALATLDQPTGVRSVATRAGANAVVLHLLPLRRDARDVFGSDGILILLAEPANASIPGADLLRLLFDLTPTEARLTRLLTEGHAPAEAAQRLGVREMTARTHLRNIFAKTGVRRQTDLIRLLLGVGAPG